MLLKPLESVHHARQNRDLAASGWDVRWRVRAIALVVPAMILPSDAANAARRVSGFPFTPMSIEEVQRAGAAGAGCSFLVGRGGSGAILAMADDRGTVKRNGRVLRLRPAPHARSLAPFTFDRWTGAGMLFSVRETGPARQVGTAAVSPAVLWATVAGRTRSYAGRLNCGT